MIKFIKQLLLNRKIRKEINVILDEVLTNPDWQEWNQAEADNTLFLDLEKYIDIFNKGRDGQSYHQRIKQYPTNMRFNDHCLLHGLIMHYIFERWGKAAWGDPPKGYYRIF